MTLNNANVFVCSMKSYNDRLKYYGEGPLAELLLLKMIYKYACYSPTENARVYLDSMISQLQRSNRIICMDSIAGDYYPDYSDPMNGTEVNSNNPPTVAGKTISITEEIPVDEDSSSFIPVPVYTKVYTFSEEDFQTSFLDPDGDGPGQVALVTLPSEGELRYDDVAATAGQIIPNPALLTYWKITNDAIATSFNFIISDDNQENPAWSASATININTVEAGNDPATVGDGFTLVDNNVTTVLVSAMFTSQLTPPYNDPDGDELDAIRVDEISDANQGQFLYNGVAVAAGQIITKAELDAGDFVHVGANVDTIVSDVINISVRDTGSLTWVS